jgi:hypothetical protein
MMFALRGLTVALSVFVLVYAMTRMMVECSTRLAISRMKKRPFALSPNGWFAMQVAPFLLAMLVTFLFAVPSFIRFEPNHAEEEFGFPVLFLSVACLAMLGAGIYRAWSAYSRTTCAVRQW